MVGRFVGGRLGLLVEGKVGELEGIHNGCGELGEVRGVLKQEAWLGELYRPSRLDSWPTMDIQGTCESTTGGTTCTTHAHLSMTRKEIS